MFRPKPHSGVCNGLLLLLIFALHLATCYDLTTRLQPQGPLGVRLDYSLATNGDPPPTPPNAGAQNHRNWVYSTHITFNSDVSSITDDQLTRMAIDAYLEIRPEREQYSIGQRQQPGALTLLAFGNEIIMSSSQRGPTSFTYDFGASIVRGSLDLCQIIWRDNGPGGGSTDVRHRTEGKCGEPMTMHMYYRIHPTMPLQNRNARITTVHPSYDGSGRIEPFPPCGDPAQDTWGCNLLLADQNVRAMSVTLTGAPYDLATIAGGMSTIDQIQLCV